MEDDSLTMVAEPLSEEAKKKLDGIPMVHPAQVAFSQDAMGEVNIAFSFQTMLGNSIRLAMDAGTFLEWSHQVREELNKILKPN